jgi:hypothetical protein
VLPATLADARRRTTARFVKPADEKSFPARVYAADEDIPATELHPAAAPVLLAEPVRWTSESRCFALDHAVTALSVYARDGERAEEDGAWPTSDAELAGARRYAQEVPEDDSVAFPPAVVLDVGVVAGRGWAVVETNAAWGAGVYGCDPGAVLPVLARASVPAARLGAADRPWVRAAALVE